MPMTVQERVRLCRLIEKIDRDPKHAKSIGVKNVSKLRKNDSGKYKNDNRYHSVPGMAISC